MQSVQRLRKGKDNQEIVIHFLVEIKKFSILQKFQIGCIGSTQPPIQWVTGELSLW